MNTEDIRWIQRFHNFEKAFAQLRYGVELAKQRPLSMLEEQGLIQAFEYTHEMAWNTLKDFLEKNGVKDLYGSRDTTRAAFKTGLLEDGEVWMTMIHSRNMTSHTYNEETARTVVSAIINTYYDSFSDFCVHMETLKQEHP